MFAEIKDFLPSWAAGEEKEDVKEDVDDAGISKLADVLEKRWAENQKCGNLDAGKEGKKYLDILR